ncbi:hypothetical protein SHANETTE_131 [Bacillus phage Shanette]|uniref:Uncharacterized protein n=2 Tax=Siminovitchvirus TaxID=1918721 RepID=S5M8G9_9CAUD|nr:hypothetical protein AVV47_gp166 [Bacillus phage JL]YP_009216126.1 hypothetical protein AVV46_gp166 [Bacillus phage Shanette]AGR46803.1 hypothetical protein JL_130 [Bacillus phage JL]AGR47025.1 hypothetical protein SHANETTE_131 [Bacillus phage Shanette]
MIIGEVIAEVVVAILEFVGIVIESKSNKEEEE